MLQSINPFTGNLIESYNEDTHLIIEKKLKNAHSAKQSWQRLSIEERAVYLIKLADYLLKNLNALGLIASEEMGKPLSQSIAELEKCASTLKFYAENGQLFLKEEKVNLDKGNGIICFNPLGTVLAIMPWNFPYWQVYRAMGPILISGNTMLLKHASNVTGCAIAIKKATEACDFPEGVFDILLVKSNAVAEIIADTRIHAITFTGSTQAGKSVAATAASNLKKQVLELGGSDAYIILKDADLKLAAKLCTLSRLNNTGQSCIAAKRIIVEASVLGPFTRLLQEAFENRPFGNPSDLNTTVGTMARIDLRDELHLQVEKSVEKGAKILCGGYIPQGQAAFYPPTILTHVEKGMPAYEEELFGPVASIIVAQNEAHAIEIANDTEFGLGAAVFTENVKHGKMLAAKLIEAGSVFVNQMVSSNAKLPFGGIKQSGYGRELGRFGVLEFVNIKSVAYND